ncbi:MAG: HAD family hydrolase, partial [Pseudomonadota bacterium]
MTNGTTDHAARVVEQLGISNHFDGIFDIVDADLIPKPAEETYARFWEKHAIDPARSAMFEDLSRNLEVPARHGMRTILVVPEGTREVFREDWEFEGREANYVEFVTDNLCGFLERTLAARAS